jgi:hypothetical protein
MAEFPHDAVFDPTQVEGRPSRDPLPAGEYHVEVLETDIKSTKARDGYFLEVAFRVIEGEYENRRLWNRINFQNAKAKTQMYGQAEMKELYEAVGLFEKVQNSSELHGRTLWLNVVVKAPENGYGASNEIKGYKPDTAPVSGPRPSAPPPQASAPAGQSRPWGNR